MNDFVNEIELKYTQTKSGVIKTAGDIYRFSQVIWNADTIELYEEFKVIFLNQGNHIIGWKTISQGGIASTPVDLRILYALALKTCATGIVCIHNHPSGNLTPSSADHRLTRRIKEAGALFNIDLIDHLIVTTSGYYSFAEEGRL